MPQFNSIQKNHITITGNLSSDRTMIFVHGFGTTQAAWADVVPHFFARYRVVLLDNAGAGSSEPAAYVQSHYLNLHAYARDLIEACDATNTRNAVFVGHSVGCMMGLLASRVRPELFSQLVFIGASPRYLNDTGYVGGFTKEQLDGLYTAVTTDYDNWVSSFARIVMANPEKPHLSSGFCQSLKSVPRQHLLSVLCVIFQSDHRGDLGKLDKPVMLIQTREDFAVPMSVAEYLQRHIRNSCLKVIGATGHLPHVSAPDQVVSVMQAFLENTH